MKTIIVLLLSCICIFSASPAGAQHDVHDLTPYFQSGGDHPGGPWDGILVRTPVRPAEPRWSLRTGMKKGVVGLVLDEEKEAAPDAAVLRSGGYAEWTALLAEFQESATLVDPDTVAALAAMKPLLIIPSGGLAGLSSSPLFRAGLARYATTGGIILCFSQQRGADLAALPVPDGSPAVDGAGWTEDSGPLFRSSLIQASHPILSGMRRPNPAVETDGYLRVLPAGSSVLLSRIDGMPTLALYPVGKGWVVVSDLFSDTLFGQASLEQDELALLRGMLLWAKSRGGAAPVKPGERFSARITVRGGERAAAASVRIAVMGPNLDKAIDEQTVPLSVPPLREVPVEYAYSLPPTLPPGIYHLEYLLFDAHRRPISSSPAETAEGWFFVPQQAAPAQPIARAEQPRAAGPARLAVAPPLLERIGDRNRLSLEITRLPGAEGRYDLVARTEGQEKFFSLDQDRIIVSFEVQAQENKPLGYAVHLAGGRIVGRGVLLPNTAAKAGVRIDQPWYRPGQTVRLQTRNLGLGSFSFSGLGASQFQMISKDHVFSIPVPSSLPADTYAVDWEFATRTGGTTHGTIPVPVLGASVRCTKSAVDRDAAEAPGAFAASLTLQSSQTVSAELRLRLVSPLGAVTLAGKHPLQLSPGSKDLNFPFTLATDQMGIWQLLYEVTAPLPEGAGFTPEPAVLAAGRVLFDIGDAGVLAVSPDQPVYYLPAGPVTVSAVVAGKEKTRVELFLDGRRVEKFKLPTAGTWQFSVPVENVRQGAHTLKTILESDSGSSTREASFFYGALLPDLTVTVQAADITEPSLEVGIGVMNSGRVPAGPSRASLYEGDPSAGGAFIRSFPVPPLDPGKQHVAIVRYELAAKAGNRRLFAIVQGDPTFPESKTDNNSASLSLDVPAGLLYIKPAQKSYPADEPLAYQVRIANFTTKPFKPLVLSLQLSEPGGKTSSIETITFPEFAAGEQRVLDRTIPVRNPKEGPYLISARSASGETVLQDATGIEVEPTLSVRGSLAGTPLKTAPCMPFAIRIVTRDAGNVPATSGTLTTEIRAKTPEAPVVFLRTSPVALGQRQETIDRISFPRGEYEVLLKISAQNEQRKLKQETILDRQSLTVTGPLEVVRSASPLLRVLVWTGGENSTTIESALAEKILKEAFDQESLYLKVVTRADDFLSQAQSGLFNILVLFEADGATLANETLQHAVASGTGIVVVGSDEQTRRADEALGFRFGAPLPGGTPTITVPEDSGLGVSGNIAVSGQISSPSKEGARAAAFLPDRQPAILFDASGKGRSMIIPFSLIRSSLNAGSTALYALLLRSSVQAAAPEVEDSAASPSVQLVAQSSIGPVKARIVQFLPPGSKLLWSNRDHDLKNNVLTFTFTAGAEPQRFLYLYQPPAQGPQTVSGETRYECGRSFVSQGKIE
ncbi:MAG: hypothetical protein M0042_02980 [Nitrospiraceae bacterium]|nr:hypothetical protein [Nitrospiraceae bacterium]